MNSSEYLRSVNPFPGGKTDFVSWGLILLWLATVLVVAWHHEMWRDEVRALSLAVSADSIMQLPLAIKNEGHPLLWYLILWAGYSLSSTPVVLQIASIAIGFAGILLFFRLAYLPNLLKILFIFSVLPMYEYTVMARSYGLSMLLLFAFAAGYIKQKKQRLLLAGILFALANTNVHSTIFVCLLSLFWISEEISLQRSILAGIKTLAPAIVIIMFGLLVCYLTAVPDKPYATRLLADVKASITTADIFEAIVNPGRNFQEILPIIPDYMKNVVMLVLSMGLLVKPVAAFCVSASVISFSYFFGVVYIGSLRHEGLVIIFILSVYWLVNAHPKKNEWHYFLKQIFSFSLFVLLPVIFLVHIYGSYKYIWFDLTSPMSSNKSFGEYLSGHPRFAGAIIVAEPDAYIESLPYYASNRIYMPRTGHFDKVARRTSQTRKELSLSELLAAARSIKEMEKAPVLIALGHFDLATEEPPWERSLPHKRKFTWTPEALATFRAETIKTAEFKNDYRNERYEIYELQ